VRHSDWRDSQVLSRRLLGIEQHRGARRAVPQTPLLTLVTYRPEYRGALAQVPGAQTIALAPLSDSEIAALVSGLLGPDPSVVGLGQMIAERACGTPFFAEEIVRDLAERGVLQGNPGAYLSTAEARSKRSSYSAGDDRSAHRPTRPNGEAHVGRGGSGRFAASGVLVETLLDRGAEVT
jgi:hypothetical protein